MDGKKRKEKSLTMRKMEEAVCISGGIAYQGGPDPNAFILAGRASMRLIRLVEQEVSNHLGCSISPGV
jgi:hypothetical protein